MNSLSSIPEKRTVKAIRISCTNGAMSIIDTAWGCVRNTHLNEFYIKCLDGSVTGFESFPLKDIRQNPKGFYPCAGTLYKYDSLYLPDESVMALCKPWNVELYTETSRALLAEVVNVRTDAYDVLIARPSKWGNPFVIGRDGDRATVVDKYRNWIRTQTHLLAALPELIGKRLGCYCAPQLCHGHVLVELLIEWHAATYQLLENNKTVQVPVPAESTPAAELTDDAQSKAIETTGDDAACKKLLTECFYLLEKLVDSSSHDNCALARDYAPPDTKCDCGLAEAKEFLSKHR